MTLAKSFSRTVLTALIFIVIDSCTDTRMSQPDPSPIAPEGSTATSASVSTISVFDKSVGRPIDRSTALRWMENFAKSNPVAIKEYVIDAGAIKEIMVNPACSGISLYYAIDAQDSLHILPIGTDVNGKTLFTQTIPTKNGGIDWMTAQRWIVNHKGYIRSHFFGILTFTRLLAQQPTQVRISFALNDASAAQLLLSNASDPTPVYLEDASRPCPPYCPGL